MSVKNLENYYNACCDLAEAFIESLFPDADKPTEIWWVANDIGGVLCFSDYFVGMENMVHYFEFGLTPDEFWEWYDRNVDPQEGEGDGITMRYFIQSKRNPNKK